MIEFDGTAAELAASKLPDSIKTHTLLLLNNSGAEADEKVSDYVGGYLYVVETEEDLKLVSGLGTKTLQLITASVYEMPIVLDVCEYVGNDYMHCWLASNNSGGNSYFIPKNLWTPNVLRTYQINNDQFNRV